MIVLGQYGVERWNAVDDEYILPPEPPQISAVAEELPEVLDSLGLAGARIEDKGRAIAVHTRLLPDPEGGACQAGGSASRAGRSARAGAGTRQEGVGDPRARHGQGCRVAIHR